MLRDPLENVACQFTLLLQQCPICLVRLIWRASIDEVKIQSSKHYHSNHMTVYILFVLRIVTLSYDFLDMNIIINCLKPQYCFKTDLGIKLLNNGWYAVKPNFMFCSPKTFLLHFVTSINIIGKFQLNNKSIQFSVMNRCLLDFSENSPAPD